MELLFLMGSVFQALDRRSFSVFLSFFFQSTPVNSIKTILEVNCAGSMDLEGTTMRHGMELIFIVIVVKTMKCSLASLRV